MDRRETVERLTSVMEVVGALLIVAGCSLFWVPAGLIVAGAMLIGAGYLLAPASRGARR